MRNVTNSFIKVPMKKRTFYTNLLRYIYSVGYYLALPGLLVRMWWRSVRYNPEYRARWRERFGWFKAIDCPKVIWIHAVSMGETLAAVPLVKALLAQYPDYRIVMTSTTPTGAAQVSKSFGDKVTAIHTPYDLPDAVHRFLARVHPVLGIILETELWPNLLAACRSHPIPLMLANARLSEGSCRGYRRIGPLAAEMVNSFTLVAAQASLDGDRFLALGLDNQRLQVTGNIKFDIQLPADLMARGQAFRTEWGSRLVWVAASTHEGEESVILEAFQIIKAQFPNILLVLVPRHPERFAKVKQLCVQAGYSVAQRSLKDMVSADTPILLGDTMGELMLFYAAADATFVGGSLVPVGGHNLIEPAILGKPVFTGPQLHNFVDISKLLFQVGGAEKITDAQTLASATLSVLENPKKGQEMGEKGRTAILSNTGALAKHLDWIKKILEHV